MNEQAVLISIKPGWCSAIANDNKTLEIRKTRPKLEPPFKVYIYCSDPHTKDPNKLLETHGTDGKIRRANGNVFAEFICDRIDDYDLPYPAYQHELDQAMCEAACVDYWMLHRYVGSGRCFYAWHISELKIYEEPLSLDLFRSWSAQPEKLLPCRNGKLCDYAAFDFVDGKEVCLQDHDITTCPFRPETTVRRPPQSWCYVVRSF